MREAETSPESEDDLLPLAPSSAEDEEEAAPAGSTELDHKRSWLARLLGS